MHTHIGRSTHHEGWIGTNVEPGKHFRDDTTPFHQLISRGVGARHAPNANAPQEDNGKETGKGVEAYFTSTNRNDDFAHGKGESGRLMGRRLL
jgi:hypothetical protein